MSDWNKDVISEFRANDGEVGGVFEGAPLLILHSKGARTGAAREHPLMYLDSEGRIFVFASKAGAESHPAWYYNVKAHPDVVVETGTAREARTAVEITGPERDRIYAAQVAVRPHFGEYQSGTERVIPVIELV